MRQQIITATEAGPTDFLCIDRRGNAGENLLIVIDMENGEGLVDLEFTTDDCIPPEVPTLWIQHDILKDLTESCASIIDYPIQAFRINVKSIDRGTIRVLLAQRGFHNF